MIALGASIGPFGLMDRVGLKLIHQIHSQQVAPGDIYLLKAMNMIEDMINKGNVGQSSGQGFYTYPNPAYLKKY